MTARGFVSPVESQFLEIVLTQGSAVAKKHALQRLCSLYRNGFRLRNPARLKGHVRRWAFNSLAQFGDIHDAPLMKGPLQDAYCTKDVFEAGLTALAHILPKNELLAYLSAIDVELDASVLMALGQQSPLYTEELSTVSLNLDNASDEELRSATLLIGMNKAPANLLSKYHPASDVLGELNTHPDPIVAQYSFWATVEHPSLGLTNTTVAPDRFVTLPPNVQAWAYRLLAKSGSISIKHYDSINEASSSPFPEVREGLAIGIRDIYYDSLDTTVVDWYIDEADTTIKERILEHMSVHAGKVGFYKDEVLDAFRNSAPNSELRARLEAGNSDDNVSLEMRKIALRTDHPMLWDSIKGDVMANTQNFYGPVNAGGISNSGPGSTGPVQIMTEEQAGQAVIALLREMVQQLNGASAPKGAAEGAAIATDVLAKPSKGAFARMVDWLKKAKEGGESASKLATMANDLYEKAAPLLDHLGDATFG